MLKQIEGSHAMAEAIGLCRPEVICAYPITPQTHIVEGLSEMVREGHITDCEYINVESEFAAMSVPINIWNDHSDAMSVRDAGWIMLFAETNQEAVDLHIQAFKLAEELSCPVMVNVDGFILTHAVERVDIPTQEQVDAFLPPFTPVQSLDPDAPMSIGAMVGPEAFMEVRYLAHRQQMRALDRIPELSEEFKAIFGRDSGGLIRTYRTEDAETVVVAMGSVIGTLKDMVDEMRDAGEKIGVVSICSFRPFPLDDVRQALLDARRVVVLEKALAVGMGGVLASHVRMALRGHHVRVFTLIAGLGGRPILKASLAAFMKRVEGEPHYDVHFLDLKEDVIAAEIDRMDKVRRAGPIAENVLRRIGASAQNAL